MNEPSVDPSVIREAIIDYLEAVLTDLGSHPSNDAIRTALLNMAGFAWERGQADLLARFVPVRFDGETVGISELDSEAGEALLKEWGLPTGEN